MPEAEDEDEGDTAEVVDLVAALRASVDAAKARRGESSASGKPAKKAAAKKWTAKKAASKTAKKIGRKEVNSQEGDREEVGQEDGHEQEGCSQEVCLDSDSGDAARACVLGRTRKRGRS